MNKSISQSNDLERLKFSVVSMQHFTGNPDHIHSCIIVVNAKTDNRNDLESLKSQIESKLAQADENKEKIDWYDKHIGKPVSQRPKKEGENIIEFIKNIDAMQQELFQLRPIVQAKQYLLSKEFLEKLADLEHNQWTEWAYTILQSEKISEPRKSRWSKYFVDYDRLPEDIKNEDRKYAHRIQQLIESILASKSESKDGN